MDRERLGPSTSGWSIFLCGGIHPQAAVRIAPSIIEGRLFHPIVEESDEKYEPGAPPQRPPNRPAARFISRWAKTECLHQAENALSTSGRWRSDIDLNFLFSATCAEIKFLKRDRCTPSPRGVKLNSNTLLAPERSMSRSFSPRVADWPFRSSPWLRCKPAINLVPAFFTARCEFDLRFLQLLSVWTIAGCFSR